MCNGHEKHIFVYIFKCNVCAINVYQNLQSNVDLSFDWRLLEFAGVCWRLGQELAGVCGNLLEALERYLEVAGAYWRFLEALEQALSQ